MKNIAWFIVQWVLGMLLSLPIAAIILWLLGVLKIELIIH